MKYRIVKFSNPFEGEERIYFQGTETHHIELFKDGQWSRLWDHSYPTEKGFPCSKDAVKWLKQYKTPPKKEVIKEVVIPSKPAD